MSGWASPAVNSWTQDPHLRFRFCFVDDLTYVSRRPTAMPAPHPQPSTPPPTTFEPSDHLRYLVSSPRTTRGEVERRLHLLKMSLNKLKGEQRTQAMGDIAFLQCVLSKFSNGFAPSSPIAPASACLGTSPPKSPRLKAFMMHLHHKERGSASGASTPDRASTPDSPSPQDRHRLPTPDL